MDHWVYSIALKPFCVTESYQVAYKALSIITQFQLVLAKLWDWQYTLVYCTTNKRFYQIYLWWHMLGAIKKLLGQRLQKSISYLNVLRNQFWPVKILTTKWQNYT